MADSDAFAREWLARYGLEPTDPDIAEMRGHLDGAPIFEAMTEADRAKLFRGMLETRRLNELFDERARHYRAPRRKEDPERLRLALKQITAIFKAGVEGDNAHVARVVRAMSERLGITFADAAGRLFLVDETMRLMLEVNETLPRLPALDTLRPTKTQVENQRLTELLESLNIKVGATHEGGPGSRLLKRILAYTSKAPDHPALKQRLVRERRRKRGDR